MKIIQVTPNSHEWLAERKNGLGGSDAAAACGLSKWRTAFDLWEEKRDATMFTEPTILMRVGHALEDLVRDLYCEETGNEIAVIDGMIVHEQYPFMRASIDGFVVNSNIIYEGKVARYSYEWGEPLSDDVPQEYIIQCQHNMFVTGAIMCHLGVFFRDTGKYATYIIKADKELQEFLVEQECAFWDCVVTGTKPELVIGDMNRAFPNSQNTEVKGNAECLRLIAAIQDLKNEEKQIVANIDECELWLKNFMGDNERITTDDGKVLVSWKTSKPRQCFDAQKLKVNDPAIYSQYAYRGKPTRIFRIIN